MRHDCDNDLLAALRMAEIEYEEKISSTFFLMLRSALYNLLAPNQLALARRILDMGHWVGLHFDMHALRDMPASLIKDSINREREALSFELGVSIDVVSFHQPCRRIIDNEIKLSCINTYDKNKLKDVFYVSDSNMGFRYGDMIDWISSTSEKNIQCLIHPEWWTISEMPIKDKWTLMLENQKGLAIKSLRTRESAYEDAGA